MILSNTINNGEKILLIFRRSSIFQTSSHIWKTNAFFLTLIIDYDLFVVTWQHSIADANLVKMQTLNSHHVINDDNC